MTGKKMKLCNCADIKDETIHKIAALVIKDKSLLIVKSDDEQEFLNLGGKHEMETFLECLEREVMEEVGVKSKNPRFLKRFVGKTVTGLDIVMDAYFADIEGEPKASSEIEKIVWLKRDYDPTQITLAPVLGQMVVPELIKMDLI